MSTVDKARSGSGTERRRLTRQPVIGRELISVEIPPDNFGLIIDLTEQGAAVQAVAPLFAGERKKIRCTLPPQLEPLELTAEVIWSRQKKEAGLRFIDTTGEMRGRIRAALDIFAISDLPATDEAVAGTSDQFNPDPLSWQSDEQSDEASLHAESAIPFDLHLESLARRAADATGASGVAIAVVEDGRFVCRASLGCAPVTGAVLERKAGLSAEAIRTGGIVQCVDTSSDSRVDPDVCRELGMASAVILPINSGATVVGLLEAFWGTAFGYDDIALNELSRVAESLRALLGSSSADAQIDNPWAVISAPATSPQRTSEEQKYEATTLQPRAAVAVFPKGEFAEPDSPTKPELSLEFPGESSSRIANGERSSTREFTHPLVLRSSPRQVLTTVLIGFAAFVLLTIPLTWYLLQKDSVPSSTPEVRSAAGESPSSTETELDSVELPALSSGGQGTGNSMRAGSTSEIRTRPVEVTTLTVRPKKRGQFQPLRLIHERRMPASAVSVTGASSSSPYARSVAADSIVANAAPASEPQRRGTVVLDVTVSKNGAVEEVRVVSGDPLLAEAAKAAVSNWHYQPATVDGAPVQGNARVTMRFQSNDKNK